MSGTTGFRRLVLELGHGAADPAMLRQAAAFARLVDAELHALFVEDEILLNVSALPFAREISPLSFEWRPLKPDRLEAELKAAAGQARRHLEEVARAIGVRQKFEVRRGDLALQVTETCVATDIVVVATSRHAASHGSQRWRETARRSAASVLFLPPVAGRRHGPVVAVVNLTPDHSMVVARRIAAQSRESLMVLAAAGTELDGEPMIRPLRGTAAQDINSALGDTRERLIVMTRGGDTTLADVGAALAAARGVPVLVVEPLAGG
jgi:nucleotide-binding universal stress UspA family protein